MWWKIFNSVGAKKWTNVLAVVELLFSLPVSNGRLERVLSQLKIVKSNRRTSLGEDNLDQLVRITVEGPPLSQWNATGAIDLWLNPFPALIKSEYSHILFKKFITHEPYIKNTYNKVPQVEPDLSHSWNHHCCLATNHHPTNNNC